MDVAVLSEDWLDVKLGESAKFELEGKSGLDVTDTGIFLICGSTEGVVARVCSVLVAANERDSADATRQKLLLEVIDDRQDAVQDFLVVGAFNVADSDVKNTSELVAMLGLVDTCGRGALHSEALPQTNTALLLLAKVGEDVERLTDELVRVIKVLDRDDNTLPGRLAFESVLPSSHIAQ